MNKCNSIEIDKANLTDQRTYRLNEITKIENYFINEIYQRKSCIKKLSKYVTTFDYIDKILIVLSVASGAVSIISSTSIMGVPVGIASTSFTLIFSLATGIIKKLLSITRNKKLRDKILMLAKSELNFIETLVFQPLIDTEMSHGEFNTIMKEKKYQRMKENVRNVNGKQENMRLKYEFRNKKNNKVVDNLRNW